jgi:FkbM family methyltransferase
MDAILSNSAAAIEPVHGPRKIDMLIDHARRSVTALAGFRVYGSNWIRPWLTYALSPLLSRAALDAVARFANFNARLGEGDLYTFANVFTDYPVAKIKSALRDVELVVDLGANVGAFSYLTLSLGKKRIIAVEPERDNAAFLRAQPFANALEIVQAAVGPSEGSARLIHGENSVTHHVDLTNTSEGETVSVASLDSLCNAPALVKMDIEGGELAILQHGLPENVRHLVLEWHHRGSPADFVRGNWRHISTDMHGATTWWFSR